MTVLFVLATIIIFLSAETLVRRFRAIRETKTQGSAPEKIPHNITLAGNHAWVRVDGKGTVTVGLDALLTRLAGAMESVLLPSTGTRVAPALNGVALRDGGRVLRIAAPVAGRVIAVNSGVLANPRLLSEDPYGAGWLYRVRVEGKKNGGMMSGAVAAAWLRSQGERMRDFLHARSSVPATVSMLDGGAPASGALKAFDAQVWADFEAAFLSEGKQGS